MYSDMSKRISGTPMMRASCLASSVLPTPVGPEKRKLPMGLVGQVPFDQVLGGEVYGRFERRLAVGDAVVLLVPALQALEDLDGLVPAGLQHLDLLEAPGQCLVAVVAGLEIREGGAPDAAQ